MFEKFTSICSNTFDIKNEQLVKNNEEISVEQFYQ